MQGTARPHLVAGLGSLGRPVWQIAIEAPRAIVRLDSSRLIATAVTLHIANRGNSSWELPTRYEVACVACRRATSTTPAAP